MTTSTRPREGTTDLQRWRIIGSLTTLSALMAIPCPVAFVPAILGTVVCVMRKRAGTSASKLATVGIVATCAAASVSTAAALALVLSAA